MARLLPAVLGRPKDLLTAPHAGSTLPGERPGFTRGDPGPWIPSTLALLEASGRPPLPWTEGSDLLLAPYPDPGEERIDLLGQLAALPPTYAVALYEKDVPLLPNLVMNGDETSGNPAADGLRAARSALRHAGRGHAEAFCMLPARRLMYLLRGSMFAELRPGAGGSLQNRRFLALALDHQRSLLVLHPHLQERKGLPRAERVLAVFPHFDDETLQCGAALASARAGGSALRMVWLTDGGQGVPGVAAGAASATRKEEAREAAAALGVDDLHFLDAPETRLRRRGPWTGALRGLIRDFQPDRVHTPWWGDNHLDHYEANRVLRSAWPSRGEDPEICASGFWTPVPGNALLPLAGEPAQRRERALAAYRSQLELLDYARAGAGLAAWYGREGGGPSECFLRLPGRAYWQAFAASGATRRRFVGRAPAAS